MSDQTLDSKNVGTYDVLILCNDDGNMEGVLVPVKEVEKWCLKGYTLIPSDRFPNDKDKDLDKKYLCYSKIGRVAMERPKIVRDRRGQF